jgi:hypothetical protein
MLTSKTYRKKTLSEPMFVVEYEDSSGKYHSFKSTKLMLKSHEILMKNNQFIKSYSVKPIQPETETKTGAKA